VLQGDDVLLRRAAFSDQIEYRGTTMTADDRLGLARVWDVRRDEILAPLVTAVQGFRVYRSYNLWGLRQNGSRQNANYFLNPSGENAFTVLRNWRDRREHHHKYEFVLQGLRAAFPEICQGIDFDLAGVTVSVGMILPRQDISVPAFYTPNGWLTALLHLCAVAGAEPGSMVAIDEVENTLHPFAIRQLIEAFREWAEEQNVTICLASHSPVLLDEFKTDLGRAFVMEPNHPTQPVSLVDLHDKEWLAQFSLGRLYELGEFGSQSSEVVPAGEEGAG
jgi:predicted ATPase